MKRSRFLRATVAVALLGGVSVAAWLWSAGGRQHFDVAFWNTPRQRRAFYYSQVLSTLPFAKELRLFELAEYFLQEFNVKFQKHFQRLSEGTMEKVQNDPKVIEVYLGH